VFLRATTFTATVGQLAFDTAAGGTGGPGGAGGFSSFTPGSGGAGGGGGAAQGGGLYAAGGTVTLYHSAIDHDFAFGGNGGNGASSGSPVGAGGPGGQGQEGGPFLTGGATFKAVDTTIASNLATNGMNGSSGGPVPRPAFEGTGQRPAERDAVFARDLNFTDGLFDSPVD
jgi:hypothetical protein